MEKYKCNKSFKELREMKRKNSLDKKMLAKIGAVVSVVSIAAGFAFANGRDIITNNDIVKHSTVETKLSQNSDIESPVFSAFKQSNIDTFEMIKTDLLRYKELHNMHIRSDKDEAELKELIEKINSNSNIIESLALNTAKAKLADAYHLSHYDDVKIKVDMETHSFVVQDGTTGKSLFHSEDRDETNLSKTILKLADTQNLPHDSLFEKTRKANSLYGLYNESVKTANKTYIAKDGKLMQVENMDLHKSLGEER